MPTRPSENHRKVALQKLKSFQSNLDDIDQHGRPCILLDLPPESLTHVTAYLSPPSLFALARTCRYLADHVGDDNTWLRAFLNQFLGITPEHELEHALDKVLLFHRTESTWRKEFLSRYSIRRRWERSRNPTVTHTPQDSSIDGVHVMSENGLLTSSLQYGIVARSVPINGKVLKGYIDASGTGLGIGNPNVEFTPNVSTCAMTSNGGTARVFWGKRNGEVALVIANRVMDPGRAASMFLRCGVMDQHEGAVQQIVPDAESNTFLSAGADGRIKLWDMKTVGLVWSTEKEEQSLVVDPFVGAAGSLSEGVVAGALKSGDILLFDLHESESPAGESRVRSMNQLRISPPLLHDKPPSPAQVDPALPDPSVAKMWLYRIGEDKVLVFVQYTDHPQVYRLLTNMVARETTTTPFGDNSFGNVSVVEPIISTHPNDNNMLIVGDQLGFVSIYDADAPPQVSVTPIHRFEAHTDGAVTAISWSPTVFATGSARGTTIAWDSLTLEAVRYFTSPAPRPAPGRDWDCVSHISLDKEVVIIVVGSRVMTWKVGQANRREHQPKKNKHANAKANLLTKGHQQYEMYKDIAESRTELEYERAYAQRIYGREREQRSTLDTLGLSELEAVEYVLMLSREEEEARQQQRTFTDEGVFEGDFDDVPGTPTSSHSLSPQSLSSHSHSLPATPPRRSGGRQYPRVALPMSNVKVQVSPPFVPEPMEAGTSISPLRSFLIGGPSTPSGPGSGVTSGSGTGTGSGGTPMTMTNRTPSSSSLDHDHDHDHFPAISSSLSSNSSSRAGGGGGGGASARESVSGSPDRMRSAWSVPLTPLKAKAKTKSKSEAVSASVSPSRVSVSCSSGRGPSSPRSRGMTPVMQHANTNINANTDTNTDNKEATVDVVRGEMSDVSVETMDDDLRFAIELSLAEARSRGEVV